MFSYRLYNVHWCPNYPKGPAEAHLQVLETKKGMQLDIVNKVKESLTYYLF